MVNADYVTEAISDSAAALTGYRPVELVGHSVNTLTPPGNWIEVTNQRRQIIEDGTLTSSAIVVKKDGSHLAVAYRSVRVHTDDGEAYVIGTIWPEPLRPPALKIGGDLQADLHARVERNKRHVAETVEHLKHSQEAVTRSTRRVKRARQELESALVRLVMSVALLYALVAGGCLSRFDFACDVLAAMRLPPHASSLPARSRSAARGPS